MHELSFGTWVIHISSVLEWIFVIFLVNKISYLPGNKSIFILALAMIPNLIGAMSAITWHIFDNQSQLYGLVTLQGFFTVIGNTTLAIASIYIFNKTENYE